MAGEILAGLKAASKIQGPLLPIFGYGTDAAVPAFQVLVQTAHDTPKSWFKFTSTYKKEQAALAALIELIAHIRTLHDSEVLTLKEVELLYNSYYVRLQGLPSGIKKQWHNILGQLTDSLHNQYRAFYNGPLFTKPENDPTDPLGAVDLTPAHWQGIPLATRLALADSLRVTYTALLSTSARREKEIKGQIDAKPGSDETQKRQLKVDFYAQLLELSKKGIVTVNKFANAVGNKLFTSSWRGWKIFGGHKDTAANISALAIQHVEGNQYHFMRQVRLADNDTPIFKLSPSTAVELSQLHKKAREGSETQQLLDALIQRQQAPPAQVNLRFKSSGDDGVLALIRRHPNAFNDSAVKELVEHIYNEVLNWEDRVEDNRLRQARVATQTTAQPATGGALPATSPHLLNRFKVSSRLDAAQRTSLREVASAIVTRFADDVTDFFPAVETNDFKLRRAAQDAKNLINEILLFGADDTNAAANPNNSQLTLAKLEQLVQKHFFIVDLPVDLQDQLRGVIQTIQSGLRTQWENGVDGIPVAQLSNANIEGLPASLRPAVMQAARVSSSAVAVFASEEARLRAKTNRTVREEQKLAGYQAVVDHRVYMSPHILTEITRTRPKIYDGWFSKNTKKNFAALKSIVTDKWHNFASSVRLDADPKEFQLNLPAAAELLRLHNKYKTKLAGMNDADPARDIVLQKLNMVKILCQLQSGTIPADFTVPSGLEGAAELFDKGFTTDSIIQLERAYPLAYKSSRGTSALLTFISRGLKPALMRWEENQLRFGYKSSVPVSDTAHPQTFTAVRTSPPSPVLRPVVNTDAQSILELPPQVEDFLLRLASEAAIRSGGAAPTRDVSHLPINGRNIILRDNINWATLPSGHIMYPVRIPEKGWAIAVIIRGHATITAGYYAFSSSITRDEVEAVVRSAGVIEGLGRLTNTPPIRYLTLANEQSGVDNTNFGLCAALIRGIPQGAKPSIDVAQIIQHMTPGTVLASSDAGSSSTTTPVAANTSGTASQLPPPPQSQFAGDSADAARLKPLPEAPPASLLATIASGVPVSVSTTSIAGDDSAPPPPLPKNDVGATNGAGAPPPPPPPKNNAEATKGAGAPPPPPPPPPFVAALDAKAQLAAAIAASKSGVDGASPASKSTSPSRPTVKVTPYLQLENSVLGGVKSLKIKDAKQAVASVAQRTDEQLRLKREQLAQDYEATTSTIEGITTTSSNVSNIMGKLDQLEREVTQLAQTVAGLEEKLNIDLLLILTNTEKRSKVAKEKLVGVDKELKEVPPDLIASLTEAVAQADLTKIVLKDFKPQASDVDELKRDANFAKVKQDLEAATVKLSKDIESKKNAARAQLRTKLKALTVTEMQVTRDDVLGILTAAFGTISQGIEKLAEFAAVDSIRQQAERAIVSARQIGEKLSVIEQRVHSVLADSEQMLPVTKEIASITAKTEDQIKKASTTMDTAIDTAIATLAASKIADAVQTAAQEKQVQVELSAANIGKIAFNTLDAPKKERVAFAKAKAESLERFRKQLATIKAGATPYFSPGKEGEENKKIVNLDKSIAEETRKFEEAWRKSEEEFEKALVKKIVAMVIEVITTIEGQLLEGLAQKLNDAIQTKLEGLTSKNNQQSITEVRQDFVSATTEIKRKLTLALERVTQALSGAECAAINDNEQIIAQRTKTSSKIEAECAKALETFEQKFDKKITTLISEVITAAQQQVTAAIGAVSSSLKSIKKTIGEEDIGFLQGHLSEVASQIKTGIASLKASVPQFSNSRKEGGGEKLNGALAGLDTLQQTVDEAIARAQIAVQAVNPSSSDKDIDVMKQAVQAELSKTGKAIEEAITTHLKDAVIPRPTIVTRSPSSASSLRAGISSPAASPAKGDEGASAAASPSRTPNGKVPALAPKPSPSGDQQRRPSTTALLDARRGSLPPSGKGAAAATTTSVQQAPEDDAYDPKSVCRMQ